MLHFLHWKSLIRRKQFESGMAEEFAFHSQAREQDLARQGSRRKRQNVVPG
jgi:hypothetical protein